MTVDVVNRGQRELPLVLCQVVRRAESEDDVVLPSWTKVGDETVVTWPGPMLKQEIGVTVKMAFDPSRLNNLEQVKAQIGRRFKARYADITPGSARAGPGDIESATS